MEKVGKCIKKGIKQCDAFGTFISFRINEDLEYCFIGFWNNTNSNVIVTCNRRAAIPFNTKFEGNIEFNSTKSIFDKE